MKPIYNTTVKFEYKKVLAQVDNVPCSFTENQAKGNIEFKQRVLRLYGKERHMSKEAINKMVQDAPNIKITQMQFNNQIGTTNEPICDARS